MVNSMAGLSDTDKHSVIYPWLSMSISTVSIN